MTVTVCVECAAGVEALERLEETVDFGGGNDVTGVGHRENRGSVCRVGGDLNAAADVVADGVVDEVRSESFDESGVSVDWGSTEFRLEVYSHPVGREVGARQDGLADVWEVCSLLLVESALAAGEGEEAVDEGLMFAG